MSNKPFQEDKRFTQVHNYVFDSLMRALSPNAFKVLMFIIRNTKGMTDENGDRIKLAQLPYPKIKEGTGIVANATLSWALKELKFFDLIAVTEGQEYEANSYSINEEHEAKSEIELRATRSEYDAVRKSETDVPPTSETDDIKRKNTTKEKKDISANANAPQTEQPNTKTKRTRRRKTIPISESVKEKQPRPRDELFDAISEEFGTGDGQTVALKSQMLGTMPTKNPKHLCNFDDPVTPAEVREFAAWYRKKHRNMALPTAPEKVQTFFNQFRLTTTKAKEDAQNGLINRGGHFMRVV